MHNIADFAEHMLGLLKIDVTGVTDVPPPTKSLSSIKKLVHPASRRRYMPQKICHG